MLAQGLDEPGAAALAEPIRSAVGQLAVAHEVADCAPIVSVSIGGAHVVPQPARSAAGALQLSDENLYRAKRQGRNTSVVRSADYGSLTTGQFRHAA